DIAKFTDTETQVFGISVDSGPALKHWSEELAPETKGLAFPLLSDFKRKVVKDYGVFNEAAGYGSRATLLIDKERGIRNIEEGRTTIRKSAAVQACSLLKKK